MKKSEFGQLLCTINHTLGWDYKYEYNSHFKFEGPEIVHDYRHDGRVAVMRGKNHIL